MKRLIALGLVLAGLSVAPAAALAHGAPPRPSVLGIETHGGPSVLGIHRGFVRPGSHPPRHQHFRHHHHPGHGIVHHQPVWVHPQWAWNGWHWVWVPGYWSR